MSGSMATQQQGLVLMTVAYITTKEHGSIPGWGSHQGPYVCPQVSQLALPLSGCNNLESWSHLLQELALRRGRVGSTVELALRV